MAKAAFQPVRRESIATEVAAQVRKEILRGGYEVGEKLPSERELALAFGVNRTTVREALQKLAGLGLVRIRQGAGAEVLDYKRESGIELLVHLLTTSDTEGRYDARAFLATVEAIQKIYYEAATLALGRMSKAELGRLLEMLDAQQGIEDPDAFIANDHAIHRAVFEGTKNIALQLLFNTFSEIYDCYSSPFRRWFEEDLKSEERPAILDFYAQAREIVARRDATGLKKLIDDAFTPRDTQRFTRLLKDLTF